MFKSFFKLLFLVILLTIFVVIVALVAAPYFVRQDQVKAFIEKNVTLPDDKKIILPSRIDFDLFPYMFFETEEVKIIGEGVPDQKFENIRFGFDFNDIWGESVDFDIKTKYQGITYDANIDIRDYKGFYNQGKTPIKIKAKLPVNFTLIGDLEIDGKKRRFKKFTLNHKKTTVEGSVSHEIKGEKISAISGNVVIDSDDIDDLRRLVFFSDFEDSFDLLKGKGRVVTEFSTWGHDDYSFRKNLDAEGSFKLSEAIINGFDLEEIARNPFEIKFSEDYSKNIKIDNASGFFDAQKGVMKLSDVVASSERLGLKSAGVVNIADEAMNLDTDLDLNLVTQKISLPLKIKGSFDSPKITPRYDEAILNNLPTLLKSKGIKLDGKSLKKELLKDGKIEGVKDNLKNLFKAF